MARAGEAKAPDQLNLDDLTRTVDASHGSDSAEAVSRRVETPRHHQSARELLEIPDALLTRSHLREPASSAVRSTQFFGPFRL